MHPDAPPPPPTPPPRRGPLAGVIVGVVITVLTATVAYLLLTRDGSGGKAAATPASTVSPTPPPSLSPTPSKAQRPPAQVTSKFIDQEWVEGSRIWLVMIDVKHSSECLNHVYRQAGKSLEAFTSDCQSWERDGHDILIFFAALWNNTAHPLTYNLRNFVLVSRDGRTFGPVNIRSKAKTPPNFLPETGRLPPHQRVSGYLTFDGRVTEMVPARLSYIAGQQTLTVVFSGRHLVI